MSNTRNTQHWLGVIADRSGMTLYAVDGEPPQVCLLGMQPIQLDDTALDERPVPDALRDFISTHGLQHASAYIALAGTGAVVHTLRMPAMSTQKRSRAIRTRLAAYAGAGELCLDHRTEDTGGTATRVLAAGAEAKFIRNLANVLGRAGLRVQRIAPLVSACPAPEGVARAVQLVLGERSTAIQIFEDGHLALCRDVLFGRNDFVAAYQRPILAEDGPLNLTRTQAEVLAREVGVPLGQDRTSIAHVQADQLWPLIAPVLQKFQGEVERTLQQQWKNNVDGVALNVLSVPTVPGLSEYLGSELQMREAPAGADRLPLLSAVHGYGRAGAALDLTPPEDRFVRRMLRPALAAAICAFLIMLANMGAPQQAIAQRAELEPASKLLERRLAEAKTRLLGTRTYRDQLMFRIERDAQLAAAAPESCPLIAISRALFATVPDDMRLVSMEVDGAELPVQVELQAEYRGQRTPGRVVAEWTRALEHEPFCERAEVTLVSGDGQRENATVSIRVVLR